VIIDIETFSLAGAEQFIEEPTAPANYKDPEKIAAYIAEAKAKAIDRCALDVDLCRVVAIGICAEGDTHATVTTMSDDAVEREALELVWTAASHVDRLIGFNLLAFDLPVLIRRSQYLGVTVPATVINLDKYRTPHVDLMERLSFNGKIKARSLDFYCRRFGIDVADASTGKDVDALVKAGDWAGVANHCRADVEKTRLLAERIGVISAVAVAS
jgi:3'-5' exonuclease